MTTGWAATAAAMASHRSGSSTTHTVWRTPSSSMAATGSVSTGSRSVRPLASDSPQMAERLARHARSRSRRSLRAFGGVCSWGGMSFPRGLRFSAPMTPAWPVGEPGCDHAAMAWVLDLDGVVWLAEQPIDGAAPAVERLRARGDRVLFATNNSWARLEDQEAKLGRMGIPAAGDVVTSAMAAATLVEPGERVLVCGGPGVVQALAARGAEPVAEGDAAAVVVGFHRDFDYERLRIAATAVRHGSRLVATNDGVRPVVAGKPHRPMADLIRALAGDEGTVVGDRPETDGAFAAALGYRFALVLSGVTGEADLPVV